MNWLITFSLISLLFAHLFADFELQNDRIAKEKSKSFYALSEHCIVYTLFICCLTGITFCYLDINLIIYFALLNGLSHFIIDFFSSRISSFFYSTKQNHSFFVTLGFDQFLHTSVLLATAKLMFYF